MSEPDPATWLRTQLDEDEREILRHGPPPPPGFGVAPSRFTTMQAGTTVLMNPRRVLTEVERDRRILDEIEAIRLDAEVRPLDRATAEALDRIVCAMTLPYADRPGYREEWRP